MDPNFEFLEVMSEVSVALAGFSVLMFSLRRAEGPRALFRAHATVASAFLLLAIALAPQLLGRLGFGYAHPGQLRVGVGHRRDRRVEGGRKSA